MWSAGNIGRKCIAKIVSDTVLPVLVGLQQKVGKSVLSITSFPSIIILENTLH
jgi:hypothetical protein